MNDTTDEAIEVAGFIAAAVHYPRMADLVAHAIRYCAQEGCALDDDQATQLYRAMAETSDGVARAIASEIDAYSVRLIEKQGLA